MRDSLVVAASFAVIFAFSSVDSAVSPLVDLLHTFFGVSLGSVLHLISVCTLGTVIGLIIGPALTAGFRVSRLLGIGILGLVIGLGGFLLAGDFSLAMVSRFVCGLSSGILAACMWWLTFHGVPKTHFQAMVAVLMSARPLATALGVPMAGLLASDYGWRAPFWLLGGLISAGGILLVICRTGMSEGEKKAVTAGGILSDYLEAFRVPFAIPYYLGMTINRMAYFGFYSMSGIWFMTHFGFSVRQISTALFYIGLGEAGINFLVPRLLKVLGHRMLFIGSILASGVLLPVFLSGALGANLTILLVTAFMILDRIYAMALVVTIPGMFPSARNKTVFGSLNTLTAWAGLTIISWVQGSYLEVLGMSFFQHLLTACFIVGTGLLYHVQARTVFNQLPERP